MNTLPDEFTKQVSKLKDQRDAAWDGIERLSAEVERLRGLVASVERNDHGQCPWCGYSEHRDCSAFSARGKVR